MRFEIGIERRAQTRRGRERGREVCNESRVSLANDRSILSEKATHSHARRIYTHPFHTLSRLLTSQSSICNDALSRRTLVMSLGRCPIFLTSESVHLSCSTFVPHCAKAHSPASRYSFGHSKSCCFAIAGSCGTRGLR